MGDLLILTLSIYGLAILVSFLVAGLIRLIVLVQTRYRPAAALAAAPIAPPPAPQEGIPAHHLAAISATVATVMGTHRIVRVQALHGRGWTSEGRAQHHASHNLPRRPHR